MLIVLPILWGRPRKILENVGIVIIVLAIVIFPFMLQSPFGFISSISGKEAIKTYNGMEVAFGGRFSPGGGSGFNIAHLFKYVFPEWSADFNVVILIVLLSIITILFIYKKLSGIAAIYFNYLSFLAFTINFSGYFFWGAFCIAMACAFYFEETLDVKST